MKQTILKTDEAGLAYPAYDMINCAHPTPLQYILKDGYEWRYRIRCLRADAARRNHAELDESTDLDDGDAEELGTRYGNLSSALPQLTVVGGCRGADRRHVREVSAAI